MRLGWRFKIILTSSLILYPSSLQALPPANDPPEEVLRTEIITEARSPLDGKSLTAAQYAQLQTELQRESVNPRDAVSPEVRRLIGLLRLRKLIKTIIPFAPIR